jgi:hypothetical protein
LVAQTGSDLSELRDELRALREELGTLRAMLASGRQTRPLACDPADAAVLVALATAGPGAWFTGAQVLADAAVNPELRRALAGADIESARDLAECCRRLAGLEVGGFILEGGPRCGQGRQWRVLSSDAA